MSHPDNARQALQLLAAEVQAGTARLESVCVECSTLNPHLLKFTFVATDATPPDTDGERR